VKYAKSVPYRNKRHLMNVSQLACQHCGADNGCQAAHSNFSKHGKSMARKADDNYVAALCLKCHHDLDFGSHLTKAERMDMWTQAWVKTVKQIVQLGQWPADVEIPEEAK
jgi:uncharacterized CHY-type Zn-finger protein